jgi:uncharacterized protein (TIGR00106 family)
VTLTRAAASTCGRAKSKFKFLRLLTQARLKTVLHANGTNIAGEWDKVFAAIKRCHEVVHEMGAQRTSTFIHLGTRTDRNQTMDEEIRSVEAKLASR